MLLIFGCATHYDLADPANEKHIIGLWLSRDVNGILSLRGFREDGRSTLLVEGGGTTVDFGDDFIWTLSGINLTISPVTPSDSRVTVSHKILSLTSKSLVLENLNSKKIEKYWRK
jgi:hypothetical protein